MEKDIKGYPMAKSSKPSNVTTAARPLSGRGRDILVANVYGGLKEERDFEPNGSTQLVKARGRGRVSHMLPETYHLDKLLQRKENVLHKTLLDPISPRVSQHSTIWPWLIH